MNEGRWVWNVIMKKYVLRHVGCIDEEVTEREKKASRGGL